MNDLLDPAVATFAIAAIAIVAWNHGRACARRDVYRKLVRLLKDGFTPGETLSSRDLDVLHAAAIRVMSYLER